MINPNNIFIFCLTWGLVVPIVAGAIINLIRKRRQL